MATIVTRTGKGSALTTAEMDANLTNLNNDKLENIVEDTTPQLGGALDVGTHYITTTDSGNVVVVDANLKVIDGNISVDIADRDLNINPGSGTGTINLQGANGIQVVGDSTDAKIFTGETNSNLKLTANGTGQVVLDGGTKLLSGDLDVNSRAIVNDATNGNIAVTCNGTGAVVLTTAAGLQVSSGLFTASGTNANATISANGTGAVVLNQVGGVVVTDTASSGNGLITGAAGKGLSFLTNAGAVGATDAQMALTNGGGIAMSSGAGVLSFNGLSSTFNGINVSNIQLKDYKETVHDLGTTSGTITPDVANGNVQKITLNGDLTFSAFANPEAGQSLTLKIDTNGTGRTLTSTMKFSGGSKTISTTDTCDIISVFYDGTDYLASLATNFYA
jgi:hypothetical protein